MTPSKLPCSFRWWPLCGHSFCLFPSTALSDDHLCDSLTILRVSQGQTQIWPLSGAPVPRSKAGQGAGQDEERKLESNERKSEKGGEVGLEPRSPDTHGLTPTHPKQGMEELGNPKPLHICYSAHCCEKWGELASCNLELASAHLCDVRCQIPCLWNLFDLTQSILYCDLVNNTYIHM